MCDFKTLEIPAAAMVLYILVATRDLAYPEWTRIVRKTARMGLNTARIISAGQKQGHAKPL
jgi:hypothetical protein